MQEEFAALIQHFRATHLEAEPVLAWLRRGFAAAFAWLGVHLA